MCDVRFSYYSAHHRHFCIRDKVGRGRLLCAETSAIRKEGIDVRSIYPALVRMACSRISGRWVLRLGSPWKVVCGHV